MTLTSAELSRSLAPEAKRLTNWLLNDALPLWFDAGFDRETGSFAEELDIASGKDTGANHRSRVQPRQIYSFAMAEQAGWTGPWKEAVTKGLVFLEKHHLQTNGTNVGLLSPDGRVLDNTFELYNQAFVLLAYSAIAKLEPARAREMEQKASRLMDVLETEHSAAEGGFQDDPNAPLKANPHMHLFEAMLGWEAVGSNPRWQATADRIAAIALNHLADPKTGAIREFFSADWSALPGEDPCQIEPGHQFEWAWLLCRWGKLRQNDKAIALAGKLFTVGAEHGVDPKRGIAMMGLANDFSPKDTLARLWSQTEWLKSALILATLSQSEEEKTGYEAAALKAIAALDKYLDCPIKGLWHDKIFADGTVKDEPAPASSLYHIIVAILDLKAYAA